MNKKVLILIVFVIFIIILLIANKTIEKQTIKYVEVDNNIETAEIGKEITNEKIKSYDNELNEANFYEKIASEEDKKVIVDFYADWCNPCQIMGPILEEIDEERDNVVLYKVNVDKNEQLAYSYRVYYIPTIVVFENGKEINRSTGIVEKSQIEEMVK